VIATHHMNDGRHAPPVKRARVARTNRRGFSLAELLLAIFILGIGVISVASIFPAGITLQRQSNDDTLGPMVAESAMALIRSRLHQSDFGAFSDFNPFTGGYSVGPNGGGRADEIVGTIQSDWPWMRPGFIFDDNATAQDEGAIDIFSQQYSRREFSLPPFSSLSMATEMNDGWPTNSPVLYGIPYNPARYAILNNTAAADWLRAKPEPAVFIKQRERYWPMGTDYFTGTDRPQYVWDCMFRRFQGRVQVAVFVYRVSFPGGQPVLYSVRPADPAGDAQDCPQEVERSPLPYIFKCDAGDPWVAPPIDEWNSTIDPTDVPLTASTTNPANFDLTKPRFMWQVPGQWILDQNNNIHRVLSGRRVPADGPVKLARPVPAMQPSAVYGAGPGVNGSRIDSEGAVQVWFMPIRDSAGTTIAPIYMTVEEL